MEYYTAERKKELLCFATVWMELENIMPSEISQAVRDKYHMISPISKCYFFISKITIQGLVLVSIAAQDHSWVQRSTGR